MSHAIRGFGATNSNVRPALARDDVADISSRHAEALRDFGMRHLAIGSAANCLHVRNRELRAAGAA